MQERDKQIELLKKQLEEFAREMDKSTSVINNLNKTFYESNISFSVILISIFSPYIFQFFFLTIL